MAKYLSDIVSYFENLCVQHPDLSHADTSGDRIFQVIAYEDAMSDFRTAGQEKSYFVRLILPTMKLAASGNDAMKQYQAGLMVGRYFSTREDDQAEMVEAWSASERIADDFMARMAVDSRAGNELFNHSIDQVGNLDVNADFLPTMGDGSFAAVLYTFNFATFRCVDPTGDCYAAWLDN
jgi:hypothetical protein